MNVSLIIEVVIKSVLTLLVHTVVTVKVDIYCKATIKIVQVISQTEICNTQYTGHLFLENCVSETSKILYFQIFVCSIVSRSLFPTYSTTLFWESYFKMFY